MTEKRYKVHSMIKGYEVGFDDLKGTFCKLQKDGKAMTYEECYNDLNRLTEENEQLKQSLENKMKSDAYWEQKAIEKVKNLEEENKQLKNKVNFLKDLVDSEYSIDSWENFYKKYNNSDINDNR